MSLEGRSAEISEQTIGENVFERSINYDAANDGIVRSHAVRLRERLKQYFAQPEQANSLFILSIPKGAYVPVFIARQVAAPQPESDKVIDQRDSQEYLLTPVAEVPDSPPAVTPTGHVETTFERKIFRVVVPVILVLCVCWALVSGIYLATHQREFKQIRTVVSGSHHPLWSRLFRKDRNTVVVAADSSLVVLQNLSGNRITLSEYIDGRYRERLSAHASLPSPILEDLATRRYTSVVDLDAVQKMLRLPGVNFSNTLVRYSRDLRPNDLKEGNFVLFIAAMMRPFNPNVYPLEQFS
jgi:hypothetical protein